METKPAIYTTEFWIHAAIQLILWLNASGTWNIVHGEWAHRLEVVGSFVLAGLYTLSRGIAKNKGSFDATNPNNYRLIPRNPNKRRA